MVPQKDGHLVDLMAQHWAHTRELKMVHHLVEMTAGHLVAVLDHQMGQDWDG